MRLRQAMLRDLPAIGELILETMTLDTEWMPFFPHGARHDPEYVKFVETILKPGLDPACHEFIVMVAELSDEYDCRSGDSIVAVAVWDMSLAYSEDQGSASAIEVKNSNTAGIAGLVKATAQGRTRHFSCYDRCMHLRIMATRPSYQQQGYAKALCEWGVGAAESRGMAVTVLTGQRGYILFSDLGFVDAGPFPVKIGGGKEEVIVKAMVLMPMPRPRRRSFLGSLLRHVA